jgi:DHA1 family bicyclomycin/chloramphenicol resistance-like MFS transporter
MGLLSSNCAALLMQHFEHNAGAASALFGSLQFGLGALASLAVSVFHDASPGPMGVVILVCCAACCRCAQRVTHAST